VPIESFELESDEFCSAQTEDLWVILPSVLVKGSLGGETSVLRTFRMSGKELVKERVSQGKVS